MECHLDQASRRGALPVALLAVVAAVLALGGALYGLFGPMITEGGEGGRTYSNYEDGLGPLAWAVFAGFGLSGAAALLGGGLLFRGRQRRLAAALLWAGGAVLLVLAGLTVLTVGWLVLPGAALVLLAAFLLPPAATELRVTTGQ